MQAEELLKLVAEIKRQKTEKQNVALKAANKGCPSRLYDTLSSFSNQDILSFCDIPRTRAELIEFTGMSRYYTISAIVQPLIDEGKLKLTIPLPVSMLSSTMLVGGFYIF